MRHLPAQTAVAPDGAGACVAQSCGCSAGPQQSEAALRHWRVRLPGAQFDVIPPNAKRARLPLASPNCWRNALGMVTCPLLVVPSAESRADDIRHTASLNLADEALRVEP